MVDDKLSYNDQTMKAINKARQKLGWILRTFRTRSVMFLRTLWNSLVQPHLDYCSVLWATAASKTQRQNLEGPLRSMTRSAWGMRNTSYWDRLSKFKLYSNKRRMERYLCIYVWKSLHNVVPSLGLTWSKHISNRTGHHLCVSTLQGPEGRAKTAMRKSVKYQGVIVFNSLPDHIKLWEGSLQGFKENLDSYLQMLPDNPEVGDLVPLARTIWRKPSNSIVDWARYPDLWIITDTVENHSLGYDNGMSMTDL